MSDITRCYPQLYALSERLLAAGQLAEHNLVQAIAYLDHPELHSLACIGIPSRFNPWETPTFSNVSYSRHLQIIEYLSRTDASAMMLLPGASLSTRAVLTLGDEQQQARFFACFAERPAWTFFAITEPEIGSDASAISTELTRGDQGWRLNGTKMLIGGALLASVGLVFARYQHSRRLVMVFPDDTEPTLQRESLDTVGLAGAGLSRLTFKDHSVKEEDILGHERRELLQGLNALSQVFERHRPMVAAMALGTAFGLLTALDIRLLPTAARRWVGRQWRKYHAIYQQMLTAAEGYSNGRHQYALTSQLKRNATHLVEETACQLPHLLDRDDWLDDRLLRKRYRDSFSFEYMEGTSNVHLLNSFRAPAAQGISL
ncbi:MULTISPECIES: acyl-CoA dehydrogenase family protein [unclassified Pseudomonas]|uniref:acyl-CoA dehydrogenase family protein n=1 Tax=unclassified Pseudomonas TaxID=196821 RepID=UPI0011A192A2|nr:MULTISPECIES: acyl-CoA dehydrogenase family protein [unclassified Pseudomonas]TWC22890.1 alkylation response protein AidB-like acyl-CoA dehydrogenase [Pseudomonas sp. SJZ075]TWC38230.1 alkylation response protein AidB-like acyl-CoA dehydrogenase [Pseudomonas sp. SJZ078]TWC58820.1 alkylation response protein AidB-like acyl-CoA dehydrogenase [Pseudomonas sp. SJZ124]TWC94315.1 alkylation response protein AidB-like acyl-CoA dehydrogenase [Pseudomonas sp. SJZ101]